MTRNKRGRPKSGRKMTPRNLLIDDELYELCLKMARKMWPDHKRPPVSRVVNVVIYMMLSSHETTLQPFSDWYWLMRKVAKGEK